MTLIEDSNTYKKWSPHAIAIYMYVHKKEISDFERKG